MPYNSNTFVVFDLETSGPNPVTAQPLELAAVAVHSRSLNIIPGSEFCTLIRPTDVDSVSDEALSINKLCVGEGKTGGLPYNPDRDTLKAPPLDIVWDQFAAYLKKHNWKNNSWGAPVPVGYNIIGYDLVIFDRVCRDLNKHWDKERQQNTLFNSFSKVDLMHTCWMFFEDDPKVPNIKLSTICELCGIPAANAHEALVDVKNSATLLIKFLNLHRRISKKIKWKKEEEAVVSN